MSAIAIPTPLPTTAPPGGARPWKWTREQYYKLGELGFFDGKRVELIRGEIIEMSPPGWPHTVATRKTADLLRAIFAGLGWVNEQSPLPTEDSDPEPDVAAYPGKLEDYTDHPTSALLVVEVSDATLDRDMTTKVELYAEAGHPEYWVVDLVNLRLHVFRDPRAIPAGGHTYHYRKSFGPADTVAPLAVPTASVKIADLLP